MINLKPIKINIAKDMIWRVKNELGQYTHMSLAQLLRTDEPLEHAPEIGLLANIQHELLASILQYAVDMCWKNGLKNHTYKSLLSQEKYQDINNPIDKICESLLTMSGFNLFGRNAFMQMPPIWRNEEGTREIAKLIYPFMPMEDRKSTSKGHRRKDIVPKQLDACLTLLCLFAHSMLAGTGGQFWSSGCLSSRIFAHLNYGRTMRQKLFSGVLPGIHEAWEPIQSLPWQTDVLNYGGLDCQQEPPIIRYVEEPHTITSTAVSRFYVSRAMILGPPHHGKCSITGKKTVVFKNWTIFPEKTILSLLRKYGHNNDKLPEKASRILKNMYSDKLRHPSILYRGGLQDDENRYKPLQLTHAFRHTATIKNNQLQQDSLFLPYESIKNISKQNSKQINQCSKPGFFSVQFVPGKQTVSEIMQVYPSVMETFQDSPMITLAVEFTEEKRAIINQRILAGTRFLLSADSQKNPSLAKIEALTKNIHHLISRGFTKWLYQLAFDENQDFETWKDKIRTNLHRLIKAEWNNIVKVVMGDNLNMKNRITEFKSRALVLGTNNLASTTTHDETRPAIIAARLFALQYYQLPPTERAEIRHAITPSSVAPFWKCMKKAQKAHPTVFSPLYEKAFTLFTFCTPVEDGKNFGFFLRIHKKQISSARIEQLFQEDQQAIMIDQLIDILTIVRRKRELSIDYGVLINDLNTFFFNPVAIIRQWATEFFSEISATKPKEEGHVQA
jgi:CRISPR-associated protein Cse2 (CRISPR_cse2)